MKRPIDNLLLSAVVGDIAGSTYEFNPCRDYDAIVLPKAQSFFTDDSVCTLAIADSLITGKDLATTLKQWCLDFPGRGYGGRFTVWIHSKDSAPYNSFGNGSAMRVSACAFAAKSEEECLHLAKWSADVTHNHPEGVKGAQAAALAIFSVMQGKDKDYVCDHVLHRFYPDFRLCPIEEMKIGYEFNETSQDTVPQSIACFLESTSYDDCIRLCISMGADADTMCAIAGSIAYAYYGEMPQNWVDQAVELLPDSMLTIIRQFDAFVAQGEPVPCTMQKPKHRFPPGMITQLRDGEVFVFGSNLAGMHGGGAARIAHQNFGAEWGVGVGMTGDCYAIPTMHGGIDEIRPYVDEFIAYAKSHTDKVFLVTRIGCGIAGFRDEEMAPLFADALGIDHIALPRSFVRILEDTLPTH